jgi:hypothetical protein
MSVGKGGEEWLYWLKFVVRTIKGWDGISLLFKR